MRLSIATNFDDRLIELVKEYPAHHLTRLEMNPTSKKIWYLKRLKAISDFMKDANLAQMDKLFVMKKYERGQSVFEAGEPVDQVFLVKEGRIKISKVSDDGKELILEILEPGDLFGAISFTPKPSLDSFAVAMEDSYLCLASQTAFEKMLRDQPGLLVKLTKLLWFKKVEIEEKLGDLIFKDVSSRLAKLLLNLSCKYGKGTKVGIEIGLPLTHEELAKLIGSSRETVTSTLNDFSAEEIVEIKRKRLIIKELTRLKQKV